MKPQYRCCVSCRRIAPREELWRVVKDHSSKKIQLDQGMGRSAYLCPQSDCLEIASRKKRLSRSLRSVIPEQVYQVLEDRLKEFNQ